MSPQDVLTLLLIISAELAIFKQVLDLLEKLDEWNRED